MRTLPFAIALALTSAAAQAQEAMPVETVAKVKDATTYIRTNVDANEDEPSASGSGFVIGVDGTTGYIVTNAHVMTRTRRDSSGGGRPTAEVYFRSGTKAETRAVAVAVAIEPERDLALLKVTNVPNLPAPIELDATAVPFETMTVYIFGFPFGEQLALGKGNPPVNVGRGQISSMRRNEKDQLTSILLDGALNPGNSGGPVVDAEGQACRDLERDDSRGEYRIRDRGPRADRHARRPGRGAGLRHHVGERGSRRAQGRGPVARPARPAQVRSIAPHARDRDVRAGEAAGRPGPPRGSGRR